MHPDPNWLTSQRVTRRCESLLVFHIFQVILLSKLYQLDLYSFCSITQKLLAHGKFLPNSLDSLLFQLCVGENFYQQNSLSFITIFFCHYSISFEKKHLQHYLLDQYEESFCLQRLCQPRQWTQLMNGATCGYFSQSLPTVFPPVWPLGLLICPYG